MKRFFLALLPTEEIQNEARKMQNYFAEKYSSLAALKSPPHITLQPPFEWLLETLPQLEDCLQDFVQSQESIPLILNGFSAFKSRVIYINVMKNSRLLEIQKALMEHLETSLGIVHEVSKSRPFAPHLTLAYRDLTKPNFYQAWDEFQDRKFYYKLIIDRLTLLIHNGRHWKIQQEFLLKK